MFGAFKSVIVLVSMYSVTVYRQISLIISIIILVYQERFVNSHQRSYVIQYMHHR